jgi:hypothetical protein
VLIWPKADEVRAALRQWAGGAEDEHPELRGVGYFGSYARGDWGVGSDLDIVLLLESSELPRQERGVLWDTTSLPVPVDLFIYTCAEWRELMGSGSRFAAMLKADTRWVVTSPGCR